MAQHSPEYIREEIKRLLKYAPPEMRAAAIALLPAAKRSLNTGYHPCLRGVPMRSWRCLLMLLTFPVSVPFLWGFFRIMEPINQKRRKARSEKLMKAYRKRLQEAE